MSYEAISRDELLRISNNDAMVLFCTTASSCVAVVGAAGYGYLGPYRPSGHWGGAAMVADHTDQAAVSAIFEALSAQLPAGVSADWFATAVELEADIPVRPEGDWVFMSTESPPTVASTIEFEVLDDTADAAEIGAFGRQFNEKFEGWPGEGITYTWLGLRGGAGELIAVGGLQRLSSGAPYLGGIVVAENLRGQGIGRQITAALTQIALDEFGAATLSAYTANAGAISLYESLGFTVAHRMISRKLDHEST